MIGLEPIEVRFRPPHEPIPKGPVETDSNNGPQEVVLGGPPAGSTNVQMEAAKVRAKEAIQAQQNGFGRKPKPRNVGGSARKSHQRKKKNQRPKQPGRGRRI
ncbi:MAG: hypothetical protein NT135_00075 [Candidatus Berkelbacteria bacterium]|nr:hypothetical protein [Candidatus Berkelbacteria bacterium]